MKNSASQTKHTGMLTTSSSGQEISILKPTDTAPTKLSINDIVNSTQERKAPKMSFKQAQDIISSLVGQLCTTREADVAMKRHHQGFPEFARDCLIRRYGVKALAVKHLKGLCDLAKKSEKDDALLKIFNELSGNPTQGLRFLDASMGRNKEADTKQIVTFLQNCCQNTNYESITTCFSSDDRAWPRASILEAYHKVLAFVRIKAPKEYREAEKLLLELPPIKVSLSRGRFHWLSMGCLTDVKNTFFYATRFSHLSPCPSSRLSSA